MARTIRDLMSKEPQTVSAADPVIRAAELMRDEGIGDVVVIDDHGALRGIVTDRDIVVRTVAEGQDPAAIEIDAVCSHDVVSAAPDDDVHEAAKVMRDRAIRRLPVVDDGKLIGVVSIGDLAIEADPQSALADISAAEGNR